MTKVARDGRNDRWLRLLWRCDRSRQDAVTDFRFRCHGQLHLHFVEMMLCWWRRGEDPTVIRSDRIGLFSRLASFAGVIISPRARRVLRFVRVGSVAAHPANSHGTNRYCIAVTFRKPDWPARSPRRVSQGRRRLWPAGVEAVVQSARALPTVLPRLP